MSHDLEKGVQISKTTTVVHSYGLGALGDAIIKVIESELDAYYLYDSPPYLETSKNDDDEVTVTLEADTATPDFSDLLMKIVEEWESLEALASE
tara:strand:+ start:362 stop:643 length:282 start_codon:yes stop_codon:yes gene_type:complete